MASKLKLKSGDIIVDHQSGDIGILIYRYALMEEEDEEHSMWAWDVYWTGRDVEASHRMQPWTEVGLLNIIENGVFEHYRNI